jgi:hypothetical protein
MYLHFELIGLKLSGGLMRKASLDANTVITIRLRDYAITVSSDDHRDSGYE